MLVFVSSQAAAGLVVACLVRYVTLAGRRRARRKLSM